MASAMPNLFAHCIRLRKIPPRKAGIPCGKETGTHKKGRPVGGTLFKDIFNADYFSSSSFARFFIRS